MSAPTPAVLDRVIDGRYRVEAEIARGGMATVYRARDLRLDRPVALKVMRADLAEDDAFVRRFVQEARAAARLSHPHIVSVYDQGEDGDVVFLAMELVDGPTLRDVITHRAPLSPRQSLVLLVPVAEALAEAHSRGLVHRDIKPENVLLAHGRRDGAKVADFGLARAISAAGGHSSTELLWGTAAYLAPEQVQDGSADARTDVYAVGLLLFELLAGAKAFPGGDPLRVAYDHVHAGAPDVRTLAPTVPAPVAALVSRAVATDPAQRPQDADDLLEEMRALLHELPDHELDALPAADPDRTQVVQGGAHTALDGRGGDLTQLVGGSPGGATRALPVSGAAEGHYARTTGNRWPARRTPAAPAARPARRGGAGVGSWVLGLLLLLVLGAGGYAYWYLTEGPAVHSPMPAVVDHREAEARSALDAEELDPFVSYAYSEDVTAGTVISADREAGTVLRHGTDVHLVVSQGPERYAVPTLAGQDVDSARAALEDAHLTLGEQVSEHHEVEPQGRVLRTDPEAGTQLPPETPVSLVVSAGPAPVTVPDQTGRPEQEAVQALTDAGLVPRVEPQRVHDDEVPEGSVVRQDPASGELARGTTVTLVVSDGPAEVTMPDVVGRQFSSAEAELTGLGLRVRREDVDAGGFFTRVREQSVEPGEQVPTGTEIVLEVG